VFIVAFIALEVRRGAVDHTPRPNERSVVLLRRWAAGHTLARSIRRP
jgi:hypothetical protein